MRNATLPDASASTSTPMAPSPAPPHLTGSAGLALEDFRAGWGGEDPVLRIRAGGSEGGGAAPDLFLGFVERREPLEPGESEVAAHPFPVRIDPASARRLASWEIHFGESDGHRGFHLRPGQRQDPSWSNGAETSLDRKVQAVLDQHVNPLVEGHGGSIHLLNVTPDGIARVEMRGGCQGCGAARETLNELVTRILMKDVPGLSSVKDVTNHDAGQNPFFVPLTAGR
ncbi:MAG: hypothetical protein EA422_01915 [Gemmatimonadales bacterium]|nr:MAG: hypothetical protein EA422_01915 [Gemmatimonadales bacterium]